MTYPKYDNIYKDDWECPQCPFTCANWEDFGKFCPQCGVHLQETGS